jgi:hypothetical protein
VSLAHLQADEGLAAGRLHDLHHALDRAVARQRQRLRAHAEDHALAHQLAGLARERDGEAAAGEDRSLLHLARDLVHGRRAEEAAHERVRRARIDFHRLADLLHHTLMEDHDARRERHRFDLIVRDVHGGDAEPAVERSDLRAHLRAQRGVEVGERFVEEEHLRAAHDRAPHGHALPLSAGELLGAALEQVLDAEHRHRLGDQALALGLGGAAHLQAELQVLAHGEVRVERVALKDHGDVTVLRRELGDVSVADHQLAVARGLEPGDDPQRRRFAAAGGPEQHEKLAVVDLEIERLQHLHVAEALRDPHQDDGRHAEGGR